MTSTKSHYLSGIARLFQPVATLGLRTGVKLQELLELLKQALVESSKQELERNNEQITISQLSLMSGVHRKDVTRILSTGETPPDDYSLVSRVIAQWKENKRFQTANGQPRTLTFSGKDNQFAVLVALVSKELNSGTILSELIRVGAVKKTVHGIKLLKAGYVPATNIKTALTFMTSDVADLIEAVQENTKVGLSDRNLHLKTEYDNVPDKYAEELREWLRKEGSKFHEKVQNHLSKYDKDLNPDIANLPGKNRIALVSFSRCSRETEK